MTKLLQDRLSDLNINLTILMHHYLYFSVSHGLVWTASGVKYKDEFAQVKGLCWCLRHESYWLLMLLHSN